MEGEKCRPLDHMRQIPFIHTALFTSFMKINFYIYAKVFQLFVPCGIHNVSLYVVHFPLRMRSSSHLKSRLVFRFRVLLCIGTKYMAFAHVHFYSREIVNYPEQSNCLFRKKNIMPI